MAKSDLTAQRLRELITYTPETGTFTRISKTCANANRLPLGLIPGSPSDNGYIRIGVNGSRYFAHRLAVLYMTGEWPTHDVDHINRDRTDNRWCNLRSATRSENMQNIVLYKPTKSGIKGVHWNERKRKWHVRFKVHKQVIHVGYFDSLEDASNAYDNEVSKHHTHMPLTQKPEQAAANRAPSST